MAAILLAGLVGFQQLPVSALPEVDYPTIQVQTFYPGASPGSDGIVSDGSARKTVRTSAGIEPDDLNQFRWKSVIVLQFALSLNIDVAEQEVQAAINAAQTFLPADLPTPPIYSKTNPADTPILTLALTSNSMPLSKVEDLADTRLAQKISQLPGVGTGEHQRWPAPRGANSSESDCALSALQINLEDLRTAIQQTSIDLAKGSFDGARQSYQIDANDQLFASNDYASVVVAYRNGARYCFRTSPKSSTAPKMCGKPPG